MIAKVCVLLAVVAAVRASALVGVGAPLLAAGHLGTVSSQSTAINHVAPAVSLGHGIAAAPLAYGLGLGNGLGVASLGLGHGLASGNLKANGLVGNGVLASNYGSVIGHTAIGHGLGYGLGHGLGGYGLGYGLGGYGLGYGLGHGAGLAKVY